MIRPDGVAIRIDSPAADALAEAGIPGHVNTFFISVVVAVSSMKTSRCVCSRMRGWRSSRQCRRASQTASHMRSRRSLE